MSHWVHDPSTGRLVRIAPGRESRPNDLSRAPVDSQQKRPCPFCAPPGEQTPPELDRVQDAQGRWLARAVPNLYPAFEGPDGACEVVIESPDHQTRFADLSLEGAAAAVRLWAARVGALSRVFPFQLFFKNEGARAGASLSHVHSQLIALPQAPRGWDRHWRSDADWRAALGDRLILATDRYTAFAPVAPRMAGEAWIAPRTPGVRFSNLAEETPGAEELAGALRAVLSTLPAIGAGDFNVVLMQSGSGSPPTRGDDWRLEIVPRDRGDSRF